LRGTDAHAIKRAAELIDLSIDEILGMADVASGACSFTPWHLGVGGFLVMVAKIAR